MTKDDIFEVIKRHLIEIIPDLEEVEIDPSQSMKDLGANSIDRVDVVIATKDELGLKFPLSDVGAVENMQGLIDFIYARCEGQQS